MKKLGQSKVEYMAAEKRKGATNQIIAEAMNVTARYVQKLWARFKHVPGGRIVFPARTGNPQGASHQGRAVGRACRPLRPQVRRGPDMGPP